MIFAIVQARMGSSRLPGKTLRDIMGKPLLGHVIYRLAEAKMLEKIVVATSTADIDNPIDQFSRRLGYLCFRGSEADVLDRYYQAAVSCGAKTGDVIIRVTGDCPLIDPQVVDRVIGLYLATGAAYVSNVNPPTFPDGLDVEAVAFDALEAAWREARLMSEREHVTVFVRNNPGRFPAANLSNPQDFSELRWTVDEEEDLLFIKAIYRHLYNGRVFLMEEVLRLLSMQPDLMNINKGFRRNQGLQKSLKHDYLVK